MIPCAPKIGASGGISLARNLYAEALFEGVASVYRLRMPINDPACRAAVTSVAKEFLFFGCSMHFTEVEKPQEGAR